MTFATLPSGTAIFLDANTWVYHFTAATFRDGMHGFGQADRTTGYFWIYVHARSHRGCSPTDVD
jgi:hypothetical protein